MSETLQIRVTICSGQKWTEKEKKQRNRAHIYNRNSPSPQPGCKQGGHQEGAVEGGCYKIWRRELLAVFFSTFSTPPQLDEITFTLISFHMRRQNVSFKCASDVGACLLIIFLQFAQIFFNLHQVGAHAVQTMI